MIISVNDIFAGGCIKNSYMTVCKVPGKDIFDYTHLELSGSVTSCSWNLLHNFHDQIYRKAKHQLHCTPLVDSASLI